jgi:hypothetical protein
MADNYLENKMDEYRRGVLNAPARRRLTPSGHAGGCASFMPFPPGLRVMVLCAEASEEIIKALVNAGCRVAFTGPDRSHGARVAQASGAQHHPVDPADSEAVERSLEHLRHNWRGEVQAIVSFGIRLPAGGEAYKVYFGRREASCGCDLGFSEAPTASAILWSLLPETRKRLHGGVWCD